MNKRTEELMQLLSKQDTVNQFLKLMHDNQSDFKSISLHEYLNELLAKYETKKSEVISCSGLNQIYGYQIFAGTKSPSRDKLISIMFGFGLDIKDAARLLKISKLGELYPRSKRDAAIIFGLTNRLTISEMDDLLFEMGEETILD